MLKLILAFVAFTLLLQGTASIPASDASDKEDAAVDTGSGKDSSSPDGFWKANIKSFIGVLPVEARSTFKNYAKVLGHLHQIYESFFYMHKLLIFRHWEGQS